MIASGMRVAIVAILCLLPHVARASGPVDKTLVGCVVDGAFYSIDERAYPIATQASLDLKPFEGKSIALKGQLYPGDRFILDDGAKPEVKAQKCPAASIALVRREQASRMAIDAIYAAKEGDHARAVELVERAVALVTPPECDTLTLRAEVMALKGDTAAADKDVAAIKAKKACSVANGKTVNPLLLQDVGNALVAKGDKRGAVAASSSRCRSATATGAKIRSRRTSPPPGSDQPRRIARSIAERSAEPARSSASVTRAGSSPANDATT
jgi:hypothetical protein